MPKDNGSATTEQARALIEADRIERSKGALAEFNEFIETWGDKWRVRLVPVWVVRGDAVTHTIEIQALE